MIERVHCKKQQGKFGFFMVVIGKYMSTMKNISTIFDKNVRTGQYMFR